MKNPCYQTTIHFEDKSKPDKVLPPVGLADKAVYQAAADYIISPDEQWTVRDQHIGAGWNVVVLYKVEPNGRVREAESKLRDLGLKCVLADLRRTKKGWAKISPKDFEHLSAENASWNSTSDILHFEVFGRQLTTGGAGIAGWGVDYNVSSHKITTHLTHKPDIEAPSAKSRNG
jgi:hypothetical protein